MTAYVYKIVNTCSDKVYVGSTVDYSQRISTHLSKMKCNRHPNKAMTADYHEYGRNSFVFELLEICNDKDKHKIEQKYMDLLQPTYNIAPFAGSTRTAKHSPEAIRKIRESSILRANTKKTKEALKLGRGWNKGIPFSEESRKKMSEARKRYLQRIKASEVSDAR